MTSPSVTLPADKFDTTMTFVTPAKAPQRAPLDNLAVLPGFNTRVKDDDYRERVAAVAESIAKHGFFNDKPFAVVQIPGDDTIYIYDGEHRFDAAKQAVLDGAEFPDGLPIAWAKDGSTVKDLTIHLAHGNNGERLNMVELASVVRRMQGLGMDKAEIADALGRTARHVDNLFVLAAANQTVKKAVASGQIAGAEAVKLLRKDSKTAAAKITEAVAKAKERGAKKATPKTMEADKKATGPKTKTVPFTLNFPVGAKMGDVLKAMAGSIREVVEVGDGDVVSADALLRFSVTTIDREAEAARLQREQEKKEAAEKRAAEKAAKDEAKAKEKADKDAKAKATKDALTAAVKGAAKKATAPKKSATEAKAAAKAHLSGGKTDEGIKAAEGAQKPVRRKKAAPATGAAPKAESDAGGQENQPAEALPAESMGGL